MSLSYEEERAFRDLHHRLGDVAEGFRRCYIAWHARMYLGVGVFVPGTVLVICGVFLSWPLAIAGSILVLAACTAAFAHLKVVWRQLLSTAR
jgi:hypothetical protein